MTNMTNAQLLAAFATLLGQPQAKVGKGKWAKTRKEVSKGPKVDVQVLIDRAVKARGFKEAGVQNETILTYNRWLEKGRRVKKGEKALPGLKFLFHVEQTEEMPSASTEA